VRYLYLMQVITAEQAQALEEPQPALARSTNSGNGRRAQTSIDDIEAEFQRKKKRELEQARMAGAGTMEEVVQVRRSGEKVRPNDPCYCGSGKKYKKCHGADA
jgi:preprotein translocase subunit SecA